MMRCRWRMPDDSKLEPSARCVKDKGHGMLHVIAAPTRSAVTFWKINPRKRSAKMIMHVDLRDGTTLKDEECWAMYHFFRATRKGMG